MMVDTAKCRNLVSKAIDKNYTLAFHAIGNEAISQAINIIALEGKKHRNYPPPRIEHCLFLNDEMIRRIKELNITVVTQPYFLTHMSKENVPHLPGIKQLPLKSFLDAGIRVAGSSDWPVASCDPLLGIERAVTRETKNSEILQKCEAITVHEAIAMYTSEAAFALGQSHDIGSLESGKRADFILLPENPFSGDKIKWDSLKVISTFLGGEKVFSRAPDTI
jgi:predicted amidohydrolase YtcJ